jgi:hypothetical protein
MGLASARLNVLPPEHITEHLLRDVMMQQNLQDLTLVFNGWIALVMA